MGATSAIAFANNPTLELSAGVGHTSCWMASTTAADATWQAVWSLEDSNSPAASSSHASVERAHGSGTGLTLGNPVDNSITYQKSTPSDAVWTGDASGAGNITTVPLKWLLGDGLIFGWDVKPGAGSSQGFCKIFAASGSNWVEKTQSPQNYTFQIGDGTAAGATGRIRIGNYETGGDIFLGNFHLFAAQRAVALTSAQINTLMSTTKTTAGLATLLGAGAIITDSSDNLLTDLVGGRAQVARANLGAASAITAGLWTFGLGGGGGGGSADGGRSMRGYGL